MKKFLLDSLRLYFMKFPVRTGKIPLMNLIDKTGLTKNYHTQSRYDKDILINLSLEEWIQKQIFYFGIYELEKKETSFWQKLIGGDQYVFDIGANIGYYTLMSAVRISSKGKVFAFEPVSLTYKKLVDNINLNNFKNVVAENFAVSDHNGSIELFVGNEKSLGTSSITMNLSYSGIKETVKTETLDSYTVRNKIPQMDVIKIDVEGSEQFVIEGGGESFKKFKPLILIEVDESRLVSTGSSMEKLYKLFEDQDYHAFEIVSAEKVRKLSKPTEGGLIIFKHSDSSFPNYLQTV